MLSLRQHYEVLQVVDNAGDVLAEFKAFVVPVFAHKFLGVVGAAVVFVDADEVAADAPDLLNGFHVFRLWLSAEVAFIEVALFFKRCDLRRHLAGDLTGRRFGSKGPSIRSQNREAAEAARPGDSSELLQPQGVIADVEMREDRNRIDEIELAVGVFQRRRERAGV